MKLRKIFIAFVLAVAILAAGCQSSPKIEYASIYIAAFDSYFGIDPGLHEGMEYLAIDMDSLVNATDDDKKAVKAYFEEKTGVEVKDASLNELKEQGLVHEHNQIDGLLLYINNLDVTKNAITIEGTKHKSGNGANFIKSVFEKSGNTWELKSSEVTAMA